MLQLGKLTSSTMMNASLFIFLVLHFKLVSVSGREKALDMGWNIDPHVHEQQVYNQYIPWWSGWRQLSSLGHLGGGISSENLLAIVCTVCPPPQWVMSYISRESPDSYSLTSWEGSDVSGSHVAVVISWPSHATYVYINILILHASCEYVCLVSRAYRPPKVGEGM